MLERGLVTSADQLHQATTKILLLQLLLMQRRNAMVDTIAE